MNVRLRLHQQGDTHLYPPPSLACLNRYIVCKCSPVRRTQYLGASICDERLKTQPPAAITAAILELSGRNHASLSAILDAAS